MVFDIGLRAGGHGGHWPPKVTRSGILIRVKFGQIHSKYLGKNFGVGGGGERGGRKRNIVGQISRKIIEFHTKSLRSLNSF